MESFMTMIGNPREDKSLAAFLLKINLDESRLLKDCTTDKIIVDEDEDGEPIFQEVIYKLGPETNADFIIGKHATAFPALVELQRLYPQFLSFRLPYDTINYFCDAQSIDKYFLPGLSPLRSIGEHEAKAIVLIHNDEYFGHVWYFTHPNFPDLCGIYGMKSSLVNVIIRSSATGKPEMTVNSERRGIAKRLILDGVFKLAKETGKSKVIVPWPLPPIIPILLSLGFVEHNPSGKTQELEFLSAITKTNNYFVGSPQ